MTAATEQRYEIVGFFAGGNGDVVGFDTATPQLISDFARGVL